MEWSSPLVTRRRMTAMRLETRTVGWKQTVPPIIRPIINSLVYLKAGEETAPWEDKAAISNIIGPEVKRVVDSFKDRLSHVRQQDIVIALTQLNRELSPFSVDREPVPAEEERELSLHKLEVGVQENAV